MRGVIPAQESGVSRIGDLLSAGDLADLQPGSYRIVLGEALARELDVQVGGDVIVIVAKGNTTPIGVMPRMRRFRVSGIFSAGMYEYDRGLALVSLAGRGEAVPAGRRGHGRAAQLRRSVPGAVRWCATSRSRSVTATT